MRKMPIVRQILLGLLAFTGMLAALVYPHTAGAISLKENSVVTGSTITLGDIFTGLPGNENKVLGVAPQPGHEMVLDARTLLRIAVALDLPWRPETSADTVVLKRSASIVGQNMIETALKTALEEKGVTGSYRLVFDNGMEPIILPQNTIPAVAVSSLNVKPESNWFEATLAAPSSESPVSTARVTGRIERLRTIPVLRETMNNGTIIGARDIDLIELPEKNVQPGMMLKPEELIGMTPRRMLTAGLPVKAGEIESPRIVTRGELVTMVLNEGGLTLTAQGKALEHGAKGDRIRVVNTASNKMIMAEVSGDKEVTLTEF